MLDTEYFITILHRPKNGQLRDAYAITWQWGQVCCTPQQQHAPTHMDCEGPFVLLAALIIIIIIIIIIIVVVVVVVIIIIVIIIIVVVVISSVYQPSDLKFVTVGQLLFC